MDEVNYIVMAGGGLVTYRFVMDGGEVQEFDDLEQAIGFATENQVLRGGRGVSRRGCPFDTAFRAGRVRTGTPKYASHEARLKPHANQ